MLMHPLYHNAVAGYIGKNSGFPMEKDQWKNGGDSNALNWANS
jgi:hypothetical protein